MTAARKIRTADFQNVSRETFVLYEKSIPNSGDRGIINKEKAMEDTLTSVARWAEGNRSLSRLSLISWRESSSSPAASPAAISTGRKLPRAAAAHRTVPAPVSRTALP